MISVPIQEALSCYEACGEPKKLVKLAKAQHYDFHYVKPEIHERGICEAIEWLKRYL